MKKIAVVGATGAVGIEMIRCLEELNFPVKNLRLTASERSVGKRISTHWGEIEIEELTEDLLKDCDIALFSVSSDYSKKWLEACKIAGCLMIDNSSAFRYESDVPLVIPEINAEKALEHKGVIANPNCTTAIAAMALWPLHKEYKLKKIIISTYQASSGAGSQGMSELTQQEKDLIAEKDLKIEVFQHQLVHNIIPHIDKFQENFYTKEEMKVNWETKKIFNSPEILISCTCVRIPVLRAHSESIVIECEKEISPNDARELLKKSPGVEIVDVPEKNIYPMPITASGKFNVEVGRFRQSLVFGKNGLEFFVSGDQLLRGAALNAVKIAELFV